MENIDLTMLAPLAGRWQLGHESAVYLGPQQNAYAPFGVAVGGRSLRSGRILTTVTLREILADRDHCGRIVFGHSATTGAYFSAGIGGYHYAYVLDEYIPGTGWRALRTEGSESNLAAGTPYEVEVRLRGQKVALFVNSVRVLEGNLPYPLTDDRIGLFAWGKAPVQFEKFQADIGRPQAFVVMQYTPPYDVLFSDIIERVAEGAGFIAYRAADVYRPGLVLEDIIRGLVESEVIVAEITPQNQNVFYELGYAHALAKPTVLLAERTLRGEQLPFDIRGHRVIFYDNTIGGKKELEESLRKYLLSIKGAWGTPPEAA